jgi:hypothetical protein
VDGRRRRRRELRSGRASVIRAGRRAQGDAGGLGALSTGLAAAKHFEGLLTLGADRAERSLLLTRLRNLTRRLDGAVCRLALKALGRVRGSVRRDLVVIVVVVRG